MVFHHGKTRVETHVCCGAATAVSWGLIREDNNPNNATNQLDKDAQRHAVSPSDAGKEKIICATSIVESW